MVNKYIKGIVFVLLMMSIVLKAFAAAPTITFNEPPTPADGSTVTVDYVNVSVTTGETAGFVYLKWDDGANETMQGSGNNFFLNKTGLINKIYSYIVYANDTTIENWTESSTRTVTVNVTTSSSPSIISFNPPSPVTSYVNSSQEFNITIDQTATINWTIDNVLYPDNTTTGTTSSYTNSIASIGTYSVKANASNSNGSVEKTWIWNVIASPGPNPVSELTVAGRGATWINWTWTNPTGGNFDHLTVKINESSQTNTSDNYYNYTQFSPGTSNTIYLQTVDTFGVVNSTIVHNQTSTLNTPGGSNVAVAPVSNLNVTYSQIDGDGNTSVTVYSTKQAGWGDHTFSKVGNYYDIQLTGATPSGDITVELNYNPSGINESNIRLYHWNSAVWEDITTNLDITNHKVRGNVSSLSPFVVGVPPGPQITRIEPDANTTTTIGTETEVFKISVNQITTVIWKIDTSPVNTTTSSPGDEISYSNNSASAGNHTVSVTATNVNGTATLEWIWSVRPKTYLTGNRVWDATKGMSNTYTWNPYSFSGFYYNLDSDLGTENLQIKNIDRNLGEGDITYTTSPQEVNFTYSRFGQYQVIGFMAEKYFAGYTSNTNPPGQTSTISAVSTLSSGQLHKVLLDDKDKRTISEGGTFALKEGYVLKVNAVDIGAGPGQIWYILLKDGSEVDQGTLAGDETYVYKPSKVGGVSDLPVILVHFTNVFRGREINAAFIEGVFQISDSPTYVKSGDRKGVMEVTGVNANQITMKNENTIDLSPGTTRDLMGNLKIMVADSSTLRFGLTTEILGNYEVRGTIYNATDEWTPMNFGFNTGGTNIGFYYDIDGDVGSEKLKIVEDLTGKRQIAENGLEYSTSPEPVGFEYSKFGSYQVIGFKAEKYFAGYIGDQQPNPTSTIEAVSTLSSSQLHKVLLDDRDKRTISEGGTITLKEGYVLQIKAVDIGAGPGQIWYVLLKDGNEIDQGTLAGGQTYVYKPAKVGSVSDLPILFVHFTSVFRGREINAAFIEGVFQISDSPKYVKSGDREGIMEVTSVNENQITMKNKGTISLSSSSTSDVMGNIKFKVADSSTLRFYPFVTVTEDMIANQLVIDAPTKIMAGDVINIKVTAGGNIASNVSISIDSTDAGQTDNNGFLNYTLPKTLKGNYNITATKLGYQKAIRGIEIEQYVEYRLSMEVPAKANQFETLRIRITYNGSAISGATVTYDNATIGTTDSNGTLNYKLETSGIHTISASKARYITVTREIEVRAPYTEYKAQDINVTPEVIFSGQKYLVRSNVTNVGTKADMLPVVLIVNGSVAGSTNVTIDPGMTQEVNFTQEMELPMGNYTIEVLDQKKVVEVKEEPLNYLLIGGIVTGLGAVIIYVLTAKSKISLATLKSKLNMEAIKSLLPKMGKKGF